MSRDWKDEPGSPGWQTRQKEDNRDVFDKALDAVRGAVVGGASAYAMSRLGSRAAKGLAKKMGHGVRQKEYLAHARGTASKVSTVGAAAGAYVNTQPKTEWRRK